MGAAYLKGPPAAPKTKCEVKRAYHNERACRLAGQKRLRSADLTETHTLVLWPYRCPDCAQWHLTRNFQAGMEPITGEKHG